MQYNKIKVKLGDYKSTINNIIAFTKRIKPKITLLLKNEFPKELKDENINSPCKKYKNKNWKISFDYFLKSRIIPQNYFNSIKTLLMKYKAKYQSKRLFFWGNNNAVIELNCNYLKFLN